MDYKIKTNDVQAFLAKFKPDYGTVIEIGLNKYLYCYTALTDVAIGEALVYGVDTGDAAGQNPVATQAATSSVAVQSGVALTVTTAAGGVWLQIYGRCPYAKVDGTTDVGINDSLEILNGTRYYVIDHADTPTATSAAIAEEAETAAVSAQTPTTGSADHQVFLHGKTHTVAAS